MGRAERELIIMQPFPSFSATGDMSVQDYLDASSVLIESCITTLKTMPLFESLTLDSIQRIVHGTAGRVAGVDDNSPYVDACYTGLPRNLVRIAPSDALVLVGYVDAKVEKTIALLGERLYDGEAGQVSV